MYKPLYIDFDNTLCRVRSFEPLDWLTPFLSMELKSMVMSPKTFEMQINREIATTYRMLPPENGLFKLETWPGFWKRISNAAFENDFSPVLRDLALKPDPPDLRQTGGTRFSQHRLIREALEARTSGLIGAPTRYGKTYIMAGIIRAFGNAKWHVVAPGQDLVSQLHSQLRELLPNRDIVKIGGGKGSKRHPGSDGTIVSIDSVHHAEAENCDLALIDEPHAMVTDKRIFNVMSYTKALKIGVGATLSGRFDGRDILLEGCIGPRLSQITFREAVEEGAICPIVAVMYKVKFDPRGLSKRQHTYELGLTMSTDVRRHLEKISKEIVPKEWQMLAFIGSEASAEHFFPAMDLGDGSVIAMAKRMSNSEREEKFKLMASGKINRCLATHIYAQGVTFPDLRVVVNAAGGGPYTQAVQKPGRLAQVRPGKKSGLLIDFYPSIPSHASGCRSVANDSERRKEVYISKGYDVVDCSSPEELKKIMLEKVF